MSVQYPIKVEKGSTFKVKISLKTSQGPLDISDIRFDGELRNSTYDDSGLPIQVAVVDAFNGTFFLTIPSQTSAQMDYREGIYVVRYIAQDDLAYRLIEGTTTVVWEGEGKDNPLDTSEVQHITITLDGPPEITTLATVGLPGPKLTYEDLTEANKEDLRQGVFEAVQAQVDVAVDAKESAVAAGNNAQTAASLIQNTYLPEVRTLKATTETLRDEAATSATNAAQSAQQADLDAQSAATIRDAVEASETNVQSLKDATQVLRDAAETFKNDAASSASSASTSADASAVSASDSSGFKDQAKTYRDEAETFKNQAQQAAQSAFQSAGTFQPTASKEYPDVPTQDTRWTLKAYTFTSGDLAGEQAVDGDTLIYELSESSFTLLRTGGVILGNPITEVQGANGITYEGPALTMTPAIAGARPDDWVPSFAEVTAKPETATRWPTPSEVGALPDSYVPSWSSITGKPAFATRWPTPNEVGALPDSYLPDWSEIQNIPNSVSNPLSPIPVGITSTSGTISGKILTWTPNTASLAPSVTIGTDAQVLQVKDVAGNAKTNNITLTAPSGTTIEGNSTLTIDKNYGWVRLQKLGSTYRVVAGG